MCATQGVQAEIRRRSRRCGPDAPKVRIVTLSRRHPSRDARAGPDGDGAPEGKPAFPGAAEWCVACAPHAVPRRQRKRSARVAPESFQTAREGRGIRLRGSMHCVRRTAGAADARLRTRRPSTSASASAGRSCRWISRWRTGGPGTPVSWPGVGYPPLHSDTPQRRERDAPERQAAPGNPAVGMATLHEQGRASRPSSEGAGHRP